MLEGVNVLFFNAWGCVLWMYPFLLWHVTCASAMLLLFFGSAPLITVAGRGLFLGDWRYCFLLPAPLEGFLDARPGLVPRACILGFWFCRDCRGGALCVFGGLLCAVWLLCGLRECLLEYLLGSPRERAP